MYSREKIMKTMREIVEESEQIKPYVFLAQPRRNAKDIPAQKIEGYHGLHIDVMGYSHNVGTIHGEYVDVARNYLCEAAVDSGAKYMLFIGDDTVFPYSGFLKLHEVAEKNPKSIVVGVYWMKLSSPLIMVKDGDYIKPAPDTTPGKLIDVYTTGLDCALIPRQLLLDMKAEDPEIPFCCAANNIEGLPMIGEDNFFYYRARKLGYKTICNTDVQCLHIDTATGKYTAWPGVNLSDYITNMPITTPLTQADKQYIDTRWMRELSKETEEKEIITDGYSGYKGD